MPNHADPMPDPQESTRESESKISNSKEVTKGVINTLLLIGGLGAVAYLLLILLK